MALNDELPDYVPFDVREEFLAALQRTGETPALQRASIMLTQLFHLGPELVEFYTEPLYKQMS